MSLQWQIAQWAVQKAFIGSKQAYINHLELTKVFM